MAATCRNNRFEIFYIYIVLDADTKQRERKKYVKHWRNTRSKIVIFFVAFDVLDILAAAIVCESHTSYVARSKNVFPFPPQSLQHLAERQ